MTAARTPVKIVSLDSWSDTQKLGLKWHLYQTQFVQANENSLGTQQYVITIAVGLVDLRRLPTRIIPKSLTVGA